MLIVWIGFTLATLCDVGGSRDVVLGVGWGVVLGGFLARLSRVASARFTLKGKLWWFHSVGFEEVHAIDDVFVRRVR